MDELHNTYYPFKRRKYDQKISTIHTLLGVSLMMLYVALTNIF